MPKFLKYIYILVFAATLVYVVIYVSKNINTWRGIYQYQNKENVRTKAAAENQPDRIVGQLFSIGPWGKLEEVPCANSKNEAMSLLVNELEQETDSESYFKKEIRPKFDNAVVDTDGYFYQIVLPSGIISSRYSGLLNIFDCNFFEPKFTKYVLVQDSTESKALGTLTKDRSEESLNKLVEILYSFRVIDLDGFGQSIEINDQNTEDIGDTIKRTDSGIYTTTKSDGILLGNTQKSIITMSFDLDKSSGEVTLSKSVE